MAEPHRDLSDYCQWWSVGSRRACYGPASLVLVRPSGETLGFTRASAS